MSTVFGKDEKIINEYLFTTNLLLFRIKANYILTNKKITGNTTSNLFGFIPLKNAEVSQPLNTISSVTSFNKFNIGRLVGGIFLIMVGLVLANSSFIGLLIGLLIFDIFGLLLILYCYTNSFVIINNGGQRMGGYEVSFLENSKVQSFVTEVNTLIANSK